MHRFVSALSVVFAVTALGAEPQPASNSALFTALRANDCSAVDKMLAAGASATAASPAGASPLMYAAMYSDTGCMQSLLAHDADPNYTNPAGATALMWAVHDSARVKLLLESGANPNARSAEGRTPLLVAARQAGSLQVIRMLVAYGADSKAKDNLQGNALIMAAEAGDVDMVKYFVGQGLPVNEQAHPAYGMPRFGRMPEGFGKSMEGAKGYSALMAAAVAGNTDCVRYLLEKGADPKATAFMGVDALKLSIQQKDPAIARLLLEKGAPVESREFRGATPLILAAASDVTRSEIVALLLEKGADRAAKDNRGNTALMWAMKRGYTKTAHLLDTVRAAR